MREDEALRAAIKQLNAANDRLNDLEGVEEAAGHVSQALALAEQELSSFGGTLSANEVMNVKPHYADVEGEREQRRMALEQTVELLDSALSDIRSVGIGGQLEEIIRAARAEAQRSLEDLR